MEALLGHWIHKQLFEAIYKEMLALAEFALAKVNTPSWKAQAVRDLLTRLASPTNMAALAEMLHRRDMAVPILQLHSLLSLMGRPAAEFLIACLETEEEKIRRQQLLGGDPGHRTQRRPRPCGRPWPRPSGSWCATP